MRVSSVPETGCSSLRLRATRSREPTPIENKRCPDLGPDAPARAISARRFRDRCCENDPGPSPCSRTPHLLSAGRSSRTLHYLHPVPVHGQGLPPPGAQESGPVPGSPQHPLRSSGPNGQQIATVPFGPQVQHCSRLSALVLQQVVELRQRTVFGGQMHVPLLLQTRSPSHDGPAPHLQSPPLHDSPLPHLSPPSPKHPPQCCSSAPVSVHFPMPPLIQNDRPVGQQTPLEQCSPARHWVPLPPGVVSGEHPPQLLSSVSVSTHAVPHSFLPTQWQFPRSSVYPAGQPLLSPQ
jgi:hypothetical protein